jgi:hypothetical protein
VNGSMMRHSEHENNSMDQDNSQSRSTANQSREIDIPNVQEVLAPSSEMSHQNNNNSSVGESGFGDMEEEEESSSSIASVQSENNHKAEVKTGHQTSESIDAKISKDSQTATILSIPRVNLLRERIQQLPLAQRVKEFLLYYRNI